MQQYETISAKKHLTDKHKIAKAVDYLSARGFDLDAIPFELSRVFYVDMDALNLVLDTRFSAHGESAQERRAA